MANLRTLCINLGEAEYRRLEVLADAQNPGCVSEDRVSALAAGILLAQVYHTAEADDASSPDPKPATPAA